MVRFIMMIALFLGSLEATEASIKLKFLTNIPVEQTNTIQIQMNQKLPGFQLDGQHQQLIKTEMKIYGDQAESIITQSPFDISFAVKELLIDLKINDKTIDYNTNETPHSVEGAQIKKAMNRPIRLHFDQGFVLNPNSEDVRKLIQDFPVLEEINLPKILKEIFLYVFALAGKDLKTGANFTIEIPLDLTVATPLFLNYEVTKIDENSIQANISGNVSAQNVKLKQKLKTANGEEPLEITLNGRFHGTASWNRQNALLHQMESQFDIKGSIKILDLEWPLNVQGAITTKSQLTPQS